MAGSRRIIEYKDFSGGEWGERQPWLAEKNQFTGNNMLVYQTGELGPRPGIRNFTPSDLSGSVITTFDDNGRLGFVQANQIKSCLLGLGGNLVTRTGTFTENPPGSWDIYQFGLTWYISTGGTVYKYNGSSITSLNTADGQWIMLHGDRLVLGDLGSSGADPATIRYSSAPSSGEFTVWDAANLIIVGDARSAISELYEQRNALVIVKPEGTFHLTGVPGINEVLRRVLHGVSATHQDFIERVWGINGQKSPTYYNGAQEVRFDHVGLFVSNSAGGTVDDVAGVSYVDGTEQGGQFFLLNGSTSDSAETSSRALVNHRGIWSYHTLGINTTCFTNGIPGAKLLSAHSAEMLVDPGLTEADGLKDFHANVRQMGIVSMVDTSGATPVFYEMAPCLDRPGFEIASGDGDDYNYERAGDNSDQQVSGSFSLREEHFPTGEEVRVRGLVVDFRKWNTGGSLTNHFDVHVDTLRPYDGVPPTSSNTLSFDEPGVAATTAGVLQRKHFSLDCVQGGGFQVHFENVRGVAIQRVQVILDTYEERF